MKFKINQNSNLFFIGIGDIGGNLMGIIFWFFVANNLEPENFGKLAFFIGVASIVSIISLLGSGNSLSVLIAKKIPIISTFTLFSLIISIILSFILFLIFSNIELSILTFSLVIGSLGQAILTGKGKFQKFSIYNLGQKLLLFLLGFGTYFFFNQEYFLLSLGISYFIFLPVIIEGIRETKTNMTLFYEEKKFIFTNYFNSLLQSVRKDVDKFIIPLFLSISALGEFNLSIQIYSGLMMVPLVINRLIIFEESSGKNTLKLLKHTMLIQFFICTIAFFTLPFMIANFFPKYIETLEMIPIISLSIIPATFNILVLTKMIANKDNSLIMIITLIQISVFISLTIILGSSIGPTGLGYAHLISYTIPSLIIILLKKSYFYK